ncbi:hypothetical protein [Flavihumibacter sp. CACIAM 22H1]|uniref:hypothetical protein n=1 Tax=Flavihumibacter sp. CACIAM 22H1 TaxID=1812911 RepID=UPI000A95C627|nr:hypothetical protein [Flavihumibacter sp. CACIAM 22H1]
MINPASYHKREWILQNRFLSLCYDETGGALTSVQHSSSGINPLNFQFPRPENPLLKFEGHFICTPRWGDPTAGEKESGALKHGDISLQTWNLLNSTGLQLTMAGYSERDQLSVHRDVRLSAAGPLCTVIETITNTGNFFRPCNLMQHPTIAAPFLNPDTRVFSNGTEIVFAAGEKPVESIHSFAVAPDETGWITAIDRHSNLLLGYCWKGKQYPWIHHWIHVENEELKYRGLEFGTSPLHINWEQLFTWYQGCFQEKPACFFLDAGASKTLGYHFFLTPLPIGCTEILAVQLQAGFLEIIHNAGSFLLKL